MQINVAVTDANNIVCQVVPPQTEVITIDRGVAGNGIVSIVPVTISTFQYLRITYTNGTVQDVGPLTSTAYTATAPITIVGNTISLATVPIASGGTDATTAAGAIQNLLPSYTGNANKRLGLNSTATGLEWVLDGGGTVTSVAASGGTTGLTFTGSPITTSGTLTLGGTLAIANGGTGATTAGDALTNLGAIGAITSTDGSVTITSTGTSRDLSVAVAAATNNVIAQVRNTTGATLTKGTVVYISGATGQIPTVSKALATSDATSAQTLGMITADLPNNSNGNVTIIGLITNIDTSAYTDGQQLYLSGTTAGAVTATKPYAPIHLVYVAVVEYAHPTQGKLFVKVQNGYELDEIHNVSAQTPSNGQTIVYNSSNSLWENNTVSLTIGVNGTLPIANGGTGQTTANGALNALLPSQTGNASKYLQTDGTNATWDAISLSTADITGTLGTANGGTGLTSFTSGGVVYASSSSALATSANLSYSGTQFYVSNTGATTGPTVASYAIVVNGNNNFAAGFTAIGEAYAINTASSKYQYSPSGTILSISATSNAVASGALIDFNAYNASGGATGIYLGAASGGTGNGPANFVIGRRTSATTWAESFRIDTSGNVGINTSSISYKLDVAGNIAARFANPDTSGIVIEATTGTNASAMRFINSGGNAYVGLDNSTGSRISGSAYSLNVWHEGAYPIAFGTTNAEKMRITATGSVGINTSSPYEKLDVNGNIDILNASYKGSGAGNYLYFRSGGNSGEQSSPVAAVRGIDQYGASGASGYAGSLLFYYQSNNNLIEGARLNFAGNFGIGTSSPTNKLVLAESGATSVYQQFLNNSSSNIGYIGLTSGGNYILQTNNLMTFSTGASYTERVRITSGGALAVANGTTSANTISSAVYFGNYGTVTGSGTDIGYASIAGISGSPNWYNGTSLGFYTNSGPDVTATSPVERARLTSSGSLLVGATSAFNGELLQVSRAGTVSTTDFIYSSAPTLLVQTPNNGVDNKAVLMLRAAFTDGSFSAGSISVKSATQYRAEMVFTYDADASGGFLAFNQFIPTSATTAERARFNNSGNFLVGTTSDSGNPLVREITAKGPSNGNAEIKVETNSGVKAHFGVTEFSSSNLGFVGTTTSHPLLLQTNDTERARITSSGNFGIGVSNPQTRVDISGTLRFTPNTADTNYSADIFANYDSAHPFQINVKNNGGSAEYMGVYADGGGANNRVAFPTGNVGIGTTSPAAKLDVVGGSIRVNEDGIGTKILTIRSNWAGVDPAINVTTSNSLLLMTANTERARIHASGGMSIGTTNAAPASGLRVHGGLNPYGGIVNTNIIAGFVSSNYSGTRYWLLHNMTGNPATAFNCMGDVHASSYTTWNLSNLWIRREYNTYNVYGGITGVTKSAVTVSIVDISYSGSRYVAIKFAGGDPGIEANLIGYLLDSMYTNGTDASFINGTSGVTENAVIATY